jgi:hypothetical protein
VEELIPLTGDYGESLRLLTTRQSKGVQDASSP